jgi:hypothetical protein
MRATIVQIYGCRNERHCFRIVIYNENTNRDVQRRKHPLPSLRHELEDSLHFDCGPRQSRP